MQGFSNHGGQLLAAMRVWPQATTPWVDLSTGINPHPYPAPRASAGARGRLPFPEETASLEALAGMAFGVNDPGRVLATPGAEAGLRLLPQVLRAGTVLIAGPTYASHADAWLGAGAKLVDREEQAGAVVLVNPNNPDGRIHTQADLLAMADRLAARNGWLIIDESFADVSAEPSLAARNHPRVVVLRSFGKFFGLAGLRLGFVLGAPELIHRLRRRQGDWPVSADALAAGLAAYADADWMRRTRARLVRDAAWLDSRLERAGLEIIGGASLFRLVKASDASDRFQTLCAAGILTRPFADQPTWLRFGLPQSWARRRVEIALGVAP